MTDPILLDSTQGLQTNNGLGLCDQPYLEQSSVAYAIAYSQVLLKLSQSRPSGTALSPDFEYVLTRVLQLEGDQETILRSPLRLYKCRDITQSSIAIHERCKALLAVGLLLDVLLSNNQRTFPRSDPGVELPISQSIPFDDMLSLPLPFSTTALADLLTCHVAKMTTKAFLEDGTYYQLHPP